MCPALSFFCFDIQICAFDRILLHTHTMVWPTETNPTNILLFLAPNTWLEIIPHPCCNFLALQTNDRPQSLPGYVILVTKDDAKLKAVSRADSEAAQSLTGTAAAPTLLGPLPDYQQVYLLAVSHAGLLVDKLGNAAE